MDAVDAIAPGEPPAEPTTIVRAWLGDAPLIGPSAVVAPPPVDDAAAGAHAQLADARRPFRLRPSARPHRPEARAAARQRAAAVRARARTLARPSCSATCRRCCGPATCWCSTTRKVIPAQLEGRRGEAQHRRHAAQARGAARLAGVPAQRQARASRRPDRFRRRRRGVGRATRPRTARRCCISTATSRSSCCSSAPAGCRCRPTSPSRRAADERDRDDYQTMFAREEGAVAAPTAALHFTPRLLDALDGARDRRARR